MFRYFKLLRLLILIFNTEFTRFRLRKLAKNTYKLRKENSNHPAHTVTDSDHLHIRIEGVPI